MPTDEIEPFRVLNLSEQMAYLLANALLTEIAFVKKVPVGFNAISQRDKSEWILALQEMHRSLNLPTQEPSN